MTGAALALACLLAVHLPVRGARMEREAMWVSLDERVFEHLRLSIDSDAVIADGWIIHLGEPSYRIQYRIECDSLWRVRELEVIRFEPSAGSLLLRADGEGHWSDASGEAVTELDGCIDVDIYASPFTNTLPIRRLGLKPKTAETIRVVFVALPDLKAAAASQRYTLLNADAGAGAVYRYEGLNSGFHTDLPVDSDGLVIEYPSFFKRIWIR